MPATRPILLMTRPTAASRAFFDGLSGDVVSAVDLCISPVLEIVPLVERIDLAGVAGVIFTSANGVRTASAVIAGRGDLPAYCVGAATTAAARASGWRARQMGQDAASLIEAIQAEGVTGPLLHLRGAHARGDVAETLTAQGCTTVEQIVYDQRLVPLTTAARAALAGDRPVILPLFSPRSAAAIPREFAFRAPVHLLALSPAVAESAAGIPYASLRIAPLPDAASLRNLVEKLVNPTSRVEGNAAPQ